MVRARRLWVVVAGIVTAGVLSSLSQGEPGEKQGVAGRGAKRPARLETAPVADEAPSRFDKGGIITYRTIKDESYFALQVQPELPAVGRRPRDLLILVSASAAQAGPPWLASSQLAEGLVKQAAPEDRVSLWVVSTPEFTESLTRDFLSPREGAKQLDAALTKLKNKIYPAGDSDLKNGLTRASGSFDGRKSRQRIILFLGDGLSTHAPITAADRQNLCRGMIDNRIAFYAVPLGGKLEPRNLHGFASGTGGAVLRTQIMEEPLADVLARYERTFAVSVLYPEEFNLSAAATESYPAPLPPVRADAPTLVVGKLKDAKELSYTIKGAIAGGPRDFAKVVTQAVPAPELDNYFLISMVGQWQNARGKPALIRANRALALAYEQNRLQHDELLLTAELAVQKNELETAARMFAKVKAMAPHDPEADAGMKIVARLKTGKLTIDQIRKELGKARPVDRLEKVNGRARWGKDQLIHLAQLDAKEEGQAAEGAAPAPPGAENFLQQRKDRILIEEQRMAGIVEANLRQARAALNTDPDEALDLLRNTLLRLRDHPDLGDRLRDTLMNRLQTALRDVTAQGRSIKLRKEQEQLNLAQTKKRRDADKERQSWEDRAEAQYRIYKSLMNAARVEEKTRSEVLAGLTAMQAEARMQGQRVPVATQAAYDVSLADYHLRQNIELKRRREDGFLAVMLSVEKSHVPFPDEPGIYFPPLTTWEAIRKLRKEKYEVSSLPNDDQGKKEANAINELLKDEVEMKDFQQPMSLKEALGLLMEKFAGKGKDLPIMVDQGAFKEENPEGASIYDTQVSFQPFPKKMRLATVLRLILAKVDPPNATYLIRRNYIEVTTIDRQTRERVLRVYPVGDLVMPISQQMGMMGAGGGMMGMRGGMMGMMGGGMMGMGGGMMMGGMGGGMMGMGGGMMGMMGMGGGMMGMMGGGMMGMGGMGMGGMGMMGMGGGMMMGGMGGGMMMGMGGGMMGMGGGMMMGGMGGGMMMGMGGGMMGGMGMGGNFRGGSFMGGFNGGMGMVGSINAPTLIMTITQVVAPNEWFVTKQSEPFNQFLGGGLNNFMGGVGVIGGQALGNIAQPPPPAIQGAPLDPSQANTISFFPPALALIVRAPSRIHTDANGGLIGGKQKRVEGMSDARERGLVPIERLSPGEIGRAKKTKAPKIAAADPSKVWQQALAKENVDPGMVIATADFLFEAGKFDHAAEFLKANLRQGIVVRPWVYEALAIALESSGGTPQEISRARLSAVALDPNDAQGFLEAARTMGQYKQWDRALAFCRQAAALEPNLAQPYADAVGFAELAKDTQAMEWAVGQLLSQDWPVGNHDLHVKAQSSITTLAGSLAKEQRQPEAERLQAVLEKVRARDLIFKLTWEAGSDRADLDLVVKEPGGSVCSLEQRQTSGGGILIGNTLTEMNRVAYVAARAYAGTYEITVHRNWGQPLGNRARLEVIQHSGTPQETRWLVSVQLDRKQMVSVKLTNGRRTTLAVVPPPAARRAASDDPATRSSVYEKLRELANPDYAASKALRGGAYTPGASVPKLASRSSGKQPEHRVFQTAIQGGNGVNLAAQARLSADQRYLRLSVTPVFQSGDSEKMNLSLIPGGSNP